MVECAYRSCNFPRSSFRALWVCASPQPLHASKKEMSAQPHRHGPCRGETNQHALYGFGLLACGQKGEQSRPEVGGRLRNVLRIHVARRTKSFARVRSKDHFPKQSRGLRSWVRSMGLVGSAVITLACVSCQRPPVTPAS